MNQFSIAAYITCIGTFLIGAFVFSKNSESKVNRIFFLYSLAIASWALLTATHSVTVVQLVSLMCARVMHVSVLFMPVLFVDFVMVYLREKKSSLQNSFLRMGYFIAATISVLSLSTDLIVRNVRAKLGYRYFMDAGTLYPVVVLFFAIFCCYGLGILYRAIVDSSGIKRNQIRMLFIGSIIGWGMGVFNFLPVYDITIFPYPYASYGIVSYVILMAFAILRYQLLDVEILIKRTVIFAGLLLFVFGMFSSILFLMQDVLAVRWGFRREVASGISLFMIVLFYEPMRNLLLNATDKYLFQKKYDYQKILKDASRGMSKIKSLKHLLKLVIHFVTMRVRVNNAATILWDENRQAFKVGYSRGYQGLKNAYVLESSRMANAADDMDRFEISEEHPLIDYLQNEHDAIELDRLQNMAQSDTRVKRKGERGVGRIYQYQRIIDLMMQMRAACVVPSFLGKDLKSILVLGEKKSGEVFTDEDLNLLYTLAQESAISIENARLYDEAINKSRELEKINAQLEIASSQLENALHETEDANKRLQDTQAQLIHEQKMATLGRLAASVGHEVNNPLTILSMNVSRVILKYRRDPNLKVSDVADFFSKMESNIQRIKAVVNTLTGLLKKSAKGSFEPLSLKLVVEETLPLVQFQTYMDNLTGTEVIIDIPTSVPLIKGDLERLQEVFLNLFTNAYHALADRKDRRINVTARADPQNEKMIHIKFEDNGSGMEEVTVKKIFNYGYTTKGEGKGSGMGLYMCRYIVELHGGEIRVSSQKGVGTTFDMTLPVFEENSSSMINLDKNNLADAS